MEQVDSIIESAWGVLGKKVDSIYKSSVLGLNLFLLLYVHHLQDDDQRVSPLLIRFWELASEPGIENSLDHQLRYATRLAQSGGLLLYEEMHKLFSLCDQIYALQTLGLRVTPEKLASFESAIRGRLVQQRKMAKLVAEDKLEDWKRELWWYSESLAL